MTTQRTITLRIIDAGGADLVVPPQTIDVLEAPVFQSMVFDKVQPFVPGAVVTVTFNATDPQGLALTFEPELDGVPMTATGAPNIWTFIA